MRRVAADAALTQCFMFENKRAALGGVALETRFILSQEGNATAFHRLRKRSAAAFDRTADVRIVAIGATHLVF